MHHPVSGINAQIHSVSLASHVSTHLLIQLSSYLCHHYHSHHPSLFHSRLKTYLFKKFLPTLILLIALDCLQNHGAGPGL